MHAHKLRIILCLCLAFFFALPPHFCYHSGAFSAEPSAPVVHTFDICIQPSAYRQLVSDVSEPNFPMQISVDSGPPTRGKIKLRGNSSKWIGLALPTQRIPVQIAFDGANPMDETIDNSCVKLINSFVPSRLLAEYMALDLFSFCGIPTPAHEFVFLRYNDVDFGLYLAVEDINENFLSKHFSLPFGSLLKGAEGDAGRPFTHSSWFGELRMDLDHGEERILSLLDALDRGQGYDKYLDIDEVLRFFACTAAYGGIGSILQEQSNFFLYDTGDKFILPRQTSNIIKKPEPTEWLFVAACKPYQSNYEYRTPEGDYYGVLSYIIANEQKQFDICKYSELLREWSKSVSEKSRYPQDLDADGQPCRRSSFMF